MKSVIVTAATGAALFLAGCAQQEEPAPVRPEPMFDKFGGGTCTEGYVYVPGSVPERAECVPDDECEPVYDSTGAVIDCPPPRYPRRPDESDSDRTPGARVVGTSVPGGSSAPVR
ncbi:hypothetical protein GQ651_06980 [Alphaproteobacteria bacterium GH1-50]|uniref:Lipoprotein n=1 Tax=Kangsaoukella pontilimi TaxID=2691042 RepID=A0A7C9IRJ7_9RHOB|nr:hypothetical protein [Kangsaoukella pontilimi]MXQ07586.1 hypothetical protein [Kangsaoukella pontilimi]